MIRILTLLLVPLILLGSEQEKWLSEVENRIDQQAIDWLRSKIREGEPVKEALISPKSKEPCVPCTVVPFKDEEASELYICMSFSVPDNIWLQLSHELERQKGAFVLRGLPKNSFKELSCKLLQLKEKGMNAPVLLNPQVFEDYKICKVPTFIYLKEGSETKLSGTISLTSAMKIMSEDVHEN